MKYNYVYRWYKTTPLSSLEGKTIKSVKLDSFSDVLHNNPVLIIKTVDGERFLLTEYPSDMPYLMTKR